MAMYKTTGSEINWPHNFLYLAEAYGKAGHAEEGLSALSEALGIVDKTGERWQAACLYRLKGTLALQSIGQAPRARVEAEIEGYFREAIEVARHQSAKSWELRATVSLARMLGDTNRRDEVRAMLAEIYNWFTEGFDTADLKDARALLDKLA